MQEKTGQKEEGFGWFFKQKRIALKKTLREFCAEGGLDPGNMSKLERGLMPPPISRTKLEEYARLLLIKEGTDDWYTFFDLAAAESGRIPKDILNEKETVERLPLLFRTLRGQKLSEKQLEEVVRLIQGK